MSWKRLFLVFFVLSFFSFQQSLKAEVNGWASIGVPAAAPAAIAYDPHSPSTVYVSVPDLSSPSFLPTGVIYKSTDNAQTWSAISSPENIAVINFAFDPNSSGVIYITTYLGVFKSIDNGSTWTSISNGLPSTGPFPGVSEQPILTYSITIDPNNSDILYVGLSGLGFDSSTLTVTGSTGIYKSTNGGASWTAINNGLPDPVIPLIYTSIVVDPSNSNILYTSSRSGGGGYGLFKSTDGGSNWTSINGNSLDDSGTATSATNNTLSDTSKTWGIDVYVGARLEIVSGTGSGQFRTVTSNTADTLTVDSDFTETPDNSSQYTLTTGIPHADDGAGNVLYTNLNQLVINPSDPNTLYVSAGIELNTSGLEGGVFKTINGGSSWTAVNTGLPTINGQVDTNVFTYHYDFALALDPSNTNTLYTGSGFPISFLGVSVGSGGVFKTTNGGNSWTSMGNALQGMFAGPIVIKPSDSSNVISGTAGCGIFQSSDFGSHWDMNNTGILQKIYNSSEVSSVFASQIKADPHNANTIVAASGCGILVSDNLGASWGTLNKGLSNIFLTALTVDPKTAGVMFAGTGEGLFKYTSLSNTWFQVATDPSSGLTNSYIVDVQVDPTNSNNVYVLTTAGPFKSTDGGYNWTLITNGLSITDASFISFWGFANVLRIDPKNSDTLYLTSGNQGVLKSTDGGTNWTEINNGLPQPASGLDIEIDPVNTDILYTTTATGLYKSMNGGNSWSAMNNGLPSVNFNTLTIPLYVGIDPTTPDTLYVTVFGAGIYTSGDAGSSWSDFNTGLTNLQTIGFGMDTTGDNLYLTTFPLLSGGVTGRSLRPQMNLARHNTITPVSSGLRLASAGSGNASGIYRYQFASGTISGAGTGSGATCATTCSLNTVAHVSLTPMLLLFLNLAGLSFLRKKATL